MSATRVARRRQWVSDCPIVNAGPMYAAALGQLTGPSRRSRRGTFHTWSIANGHRHKTFQLALRTAREDAGLSPTSSNMHTDHGGGTASPRTRVAVRHMAKESVPA